MSRKTWTNEKEFLHALNDHLPTKRGVPVRKAIEEWLSENVLVGGKKLWLDSEEYTKARSVHLKTRGNISFEVSIKEWLDKNRLFEIRPGGRPRCGWIVPFPKSEPIKKKPVKRTRRP